MPFDKTEFMNLSRRTDMTFYHDEAVMSRFQGWLEQQRNSGRLKPWSIETSSFIPVLRWNEFVERGSRPDYIVKTFLLSHFRKYLSERDYETWADDLKNGNIVLNAHLSIHPTTGEDKDAILENWELKYGKWVNEHFVADPPMPPETVQHIPFEIHGTELWGIQWGDFEEIDEIFQTLGSDEFDISYPEEMRKFTAWFAQHGIVHVYVGDAYPALSIHEDGIIVRALEEDEDWSGRIPSHFWVTMAEPATLVNLLSSKIGRERADELVSRYRAESKSVVIPVQPGMKHIYAAFSPEIFQEQSREIASERGWGEQKNLFMLANHELDFRFQPSKTIPSI